MNVHSEPSSASGKGYLYLWTLVAAYVGVYLCRKNMSVAVPLLQTEWDLTKEQVGYISSLSSAAYAIGKICFGPVTDRIGGRRSLLLSMTLVAAFGGAGAFAPGLGAMVLLYSMNRLAGSAGWGAMVKLVPDWFGGPKLAFAYGLLALSYVFGGALAVSFAGLVAKWTGDSWTAVMGIPSLVLGGLALACWLILPRPKPRAAAEKHVQEKPREPLLNRIAGLFRDRRFLLVLSLSFTLTLLRETFNFWTVDFIKTEGGAEMSSSVAAFLSTPFDVCGAMGVIAVGWIFGRLGANGRMWLLISFLACMAVLLVGLPTLFSHGLWTLAIGLGALGFLVYGPYSLVSGVLVYEVRGKDQAATVSGLVDGFGYVAGFLSGVLFGRILMIGGYTLGFQIMAGVTLAAAFICWLAYERPAAVPETPKVSIL